MKSVFGRFFGNQGKHNNDRSEAQDMTASLPDDGDVRTTGFPLIPDDYHLQHVGKTAQGNGYWIDFQLALQKDGMHDFVAAYVFDRQGSLISCEVVDLGLRNDISSRTLDEIIGKLKNKIDARDTTEILVKPFCVSFYGHTFGLVVRENEDGAEVSDEVFIDAMPGHTLMFYGPWSQCNYDT